MKTKNIFKLIFLVMLFTILVACGNNNNGNTDNVNKENENEATSSSKSLSIYTAFPEQEVITYIKEFEEETGIEVNFVRLSAGETFARLKAEAANPQASIWYGGPSDTFIAAAQDDLIEPYQPENVNRLPEQFLDKDGYWTPIYVGALGFASNKNWLEEKGLDAPTSWDDLLKPEFEKEIMMAHPSSSGTAYTAYATIVQLLDDEDEAILYLNSLDKNIKQYTSSGSAPARQAGLGETGIGIAFAHDILAPLNEGYPIEITFPSDGTGYEVGAVALIKNGPKDELENAKKFINWSITKAAQDLYTDSGSFRLPVNSDAKLPDGATQLSELEVVDYDAVWAGENRNRLLQRFNDEVRGEEAAQ